MPSMANITIKMADGTTDVTYSAVKAASGDGDWALWRATSAYPRLQAPQFSMQGSASGQNFRRVRSRFVFPVVRTISGQDSTVGVPIANSDVRFSGFLTDDEINEFVEQHANLLRSALVAAIQKSGYGPTSS